MVHGEQWFADPQTCGPAKAGTSELLREQMLERPAGIETVFSGKKRLIGNGLLNCRRK